MGQDMALIQAFKPQLGDPPGEDQHQRSQRREGIEAHFIRFTLRSGASFSLPTSSKNGLYYSTVGIT
jgi:hypothetical protein